MTWQECPRPVARVKGKTLEFQERGKSLEGEVAPAIEVLTLLQPKGFPGSGIPQPSVRVDESGSLTSDVKST